MGQNSIWRLLQLCRHAQVPPVNAPSFCKQYLWLQVSAYNQCLWLEKSDHLIIPLLIQPVISGLCSHLVRMYRFHYEYYTPTSPPPPLPPLPPPPQLPPPLSTSIPSELSRSLGRYISTDIGLCY